jgi:hypothetical protein
MSGPSVALAKDCVNRAFESGLNDGVGYERHVFHSLFATADQKEGMDAFVNKRKPVFKQRLKGPARALPALSGQGPGATQVGSSQGAARPGVEARAAVAVGVQFQPVDGRDGAETTRSARGCRAQGCGVGPARAGRQRRQVVLRAGRHLQARPARRHLQPAVSSASARAAAAASSAGDHSTSVPAGWAAICAALGLRVGIDQQRAPGRSSVAQHHAARVGRFAVHRGQHTHAPGVVAVAWRRACNSAQMAASIAGRLSSPLPSGRRRASRPGCLQAFSRRSAGNRITSRMLGLSVISITSRSMPMPQPPAGGMPYSSARMKSAS